MKLRKNIDMYNYVNHIRAINWIAQLKNIILVIIIDACKKHLLQSLKIEQNHLNIESMLLINWIHFVKSLKIVNVKARIHICIQ